MRKLVAIVVTAVAIVAVIIYFTRSPSDTAAGVPSAPERPSPQVHEGAVTSAADARTQPPAQQSEVTKHDDAPALSDTSAQPASSTFKQSHPAAAPLTAEQQDQAACLAAWERRVARERAPLDAEPKDAEWAYPMEQKLREHMTQKLQSGRLEVLSIDCWTTFCEIKALVLDSAGSGEFNAAIRDLNGKPWNDFTGMRTSISEEAGKTIYSGRLTRPQFKQSAPSPEEARAEAACMARLTERQNQERAARDAEPKDTSWAGPIEQLLRQYLATKVGKQPIERLDIDCRTTFCKIEADGRTSEASSALQVAVQAAVAEPWANLRTRESRSSGYGDTWKQQYFLDRQ